MSLFGTGRREGIFAALGIAAFALAVHAVGIATGLGDGLDGDRALAHGMATAHGLLAAGEWPLWDPSGAGAPITSRGAQLLYPPWWLLGRGEDELWLPVLAAVHAALACALAFRFLRAHGRSRYAAFVGGAAYGLGAQVGALFGNLPELAAMAWAPLPLEVFLRLARAERHRHLGAWLGPALAVPFLTGGAITATATAVLTMLWLLRTAAHERHRRASLLLQGTAALAIAALLLAPRWLLQLEAGIPATTPLPPISWRQPVERVLGPLLLFLLVLGVFRRQRNAPIGRWLGLAVVGAAVAIWLPTLPWTLPGPSPWPTGAGALWWPVHLALVLLASNSLDDFLDQPQRRRRATRAALLLCALLAPLAFVFDTTATLHVEAAVLLALAVLFTTWRVLGILGFKLVVATAALVWLASATLHEQARAVRTPAPPPTLATVHRPAPPPAAPMLETPSPEQSPRARIAFDLRPAMPDHDPLPLPRPQVSWTEIDGLPAGFTAAPASNATVTLDAEGATWSSYTAVLPAGHGALVVADTFAPGWTATIDGTPAPVLRADGAARAVLLGPGRHQVRFDYRPLALRYGSQLVSLGAAVTLVWLLLVFARRSDSSRKNVRRDRRSRSATRPPTAAMPAIAANIGAPPLR